MESIFSSHFATFVMYAAGIFLSLAVVTLTGCAISRTIRQSGACTFLWQEDGKEGTVRHE
ncbi:MAG: hypothetical protein IH600_18190 [Bacteroidetes bacterium]|nr:hypothetical protein [Bacteroidota bacterium]